VYGPSWKPATLKDAIAILKRADFFSVSINPSFVTDAPHVLIAAERCRVTTKLDFADYGHDRVSSNWQTNWMLGRKRQMAKEPR
jgi:hypothetical protein